MDTIHCISNETWERYANNTLGEAELIALQNHADTCELCADTKEGIDLMARPETLGKTVLELNSRAATYIAAQPKESKKRLAPLWYWSAAAMVLIVVGAGWWMVTSQPTGLTENTPTKPTEQSRVEVEKENRDQSVIFGEKPVKPAPEIVNKKFDETDIPTTVAPVFQSETLGDVAITRNEEKEAIEEVTAVLEKKKAPVDTNTQVNNILLNRSTDFKTTETLPSSIFSNNAMTNNNSLTYTWDFGDAANSIDSGVYYSAVRLYAKKHYDSCVSSLEPLTSESQSNYYEDALFLKAKVLVEQNKLTEAKKILKSIIALKKKRRKEAQSLLNTLK